MRLRKSGERISISARECDGAKIIIFTPLRFELPRAPNLGVGDLPAAGDQPYASAEIGDKGFFADRAAGAKRVSIEKNIARHRAAVARAENEQAEVAIERDPGVEIVRRRTSDAAGTRELHAKITRQ